MSNKLIGTLNNMLNFYKLFVHDVPPPTDASETHPLGRMGALAGARDATTVTAHLWMRMRVVAGPAASCRTW